MPWLAAFTWGVSASWPSGRWGFGEPVSWCIAAHWFKGVVNNRGHGEEAWSSFDIWNAFSESDIRRPSPHPPTPASLSPTTTQMSHALFWVISFVFFCCFCSQCWHIGFSKNAQYSLNNCLLLLRCHECVQIILIGARSSDNVQANCAAQCARLEDKEASFTSLSVLNWDIGKLYKKAIKIFTYLCINYSFLIMMIDYQGI